MCGIGGVRRFGKTPIAKYQVDMLFSSLEHRGRDASGIAIQQENGEVSIHKDGKRATEYLASQGYRDYMEANLRPTTRTVLVHTRSATGTATPINNKNNHPLYSGVTAVVHNGVIHNDDELFKNRGWERGAETDTDAIRALLDAEGFTKKGIRLLSSLSGSAAIAAVSNEYPHLLMLARSGNPIELASTQDQLFWASEKSCLYKAIRPWVQRFGLPFQKGQPDVSFLTLPADTAYLFNEREMVWRDKFETLSYTAHFRNTGGWVDNEWYSKQLVTANEIADGDDAETVLVGPPSATLVLCPSCKVANKVTAKQMELPMVKLHCGKCQKAIGSLPKKGK